MNKLRLTSAALAISLAASSLAFAQTAPVGGPDAKGNAPVKHVHTVNDGSARPGANSFTEGQARKHILNSGYTSVSGLTKGQDGVWRGMATHNGAQVPVALDFKGNVTEGPAPPAPRAMRPAVAATTTTTTSSSDTASTNGGDQAAGAATMAAGAGAGMAMHHHHRHHHHRMHHRRRHGGRCANPTPNGAACSGIDRNGNGVSDKEDRAISQGATP